MSLDATRAEGLLADPPVVEEAGAVQALPGRVLWVMSAACGAAVANTYYNQPLLSDFARYFHATDARAGLVATAAQVGYGVGLFFFVPLGDLVERRRLVLALAWACALLLAGMAASPNLPVLIACQFLVGMAGVSSQVLIPLGLDLTPPRQRGHTVGVLMAGLLCGILLARTVAGLVGARFGWRVMYDLAAGLMLVTGFVLLATLPHRRPALRMRYGPLLRSMVGLLRTQPQLWVASLVSALSFAGFTAFWTTLSFLMVKRFGAGAAEAGLFGIVGIAGALAAPLAGKLSDRRGPAFTVTLSLACCAAAFLIMWQWVTVAGLIAGVLLMDLGVQSIQVAEQSLVMALVPAARSRINTVYMVMRFMGGAAGSALGAAAWTRYDWGGVCGVSLAMAALAVVIHLAGSRRGAEVPAGV